MPVWTLNDTPLDVLGLRLEGGHFRAQGVSTMRLERDCDYDAAAIFAFGAAVTLKRDADTVFQGRVDSLPVAADGDGEGHGLTLVDAWADLEKTIYQEEWAYGTGTILLPRAVLGLGYNDISLSWERITVGAQIRAILEFAGSCGTSITIGSIPDGETMIPSEVANQSCAELIQQCLKLHPDWVPALDHSTTPPTFSVLACGTTATASFLVDGTGETAGFEVVHRTDMLPDAVRIIYEFAISIGDEVYRDVITDKWPAGGPDSGPRVITATVPLAGLQMQIQKSRIQTRSLPTTNDEARAYLALKFPAIAAVDQDHFRVIAWTSTLVPDSETKPPEIDPLRAPILVPADASALPNELVEGQLEDWMRRKSGKVRLDFKVRKLDTSTLAEREALDTLPDCFYITATNAVTKLYKGITQWVAPEDVPSGIAQATYEAIVAAMTYEGSVTIESADVGATAYHGKAINLTGGPAGWATMRAPVHSVDFDVESGRTTISFGPHPLLAPTDFLELQRILRYRPARWWSTEERASNQLGAAGSPSASGDTVGGHTGPRSEEWKATPDREQFQVHAMAYNGTTWTCRVKAGRVLTINPESALGATMQYVTPTPAETTEFTVADGDTVCCKVTTDKRDLVTSAVILVSAATSTHAEPDLVAGGGVDGVYYYRLAEMGIVDGIMKVTRQYHQGGPIIHRPGRNDRNMDLVIHWMEEDTDGILVPPAYGNLTTKLSWRQGLYVGRDAGSAANLETNHVLSLVTWRP